MSHLRKLYFHIVLVIVLKKATLSFVDKSLPTSYEYYTEGGITEGLSYNQEAFTLNKKHITIYSGSFHYFRVPRAHWRDRLRKMGAAGLNTVETYIPWNLHEPQPGLYDFGDGGTDMEDFLHLEQFLNAAKEEDLFAIVRPGPYIGAEWEFGGLPSWILRDTAKVRTSKDDSFLNHVRRYFEKLLPMLANMEFTKGGPIIAMQIENEYESTRENDTSYLQELKNMFDVNGVKTLLCIADYYTEGVVILPGVLQTISLDANPKLQLDQLKQLQSKKPTMVMKFWTGLYDHMAGDHHYRNFMAFRAHLDMILNYPASFNLYMFVGGTNYGFLNGGSSLYSGVNNSGYQPDTTSYDCDAPLAENGDYTEKWYIVRELIRVYNPVRTKTPDPPALVNRIAYEPIKVEKQLLLSEIIDKLENKIDGEYIVPMEKLPINNNSGQSYGYIVYRKTNLDIPSNVSLIIEDYVRDVVLVLLNGMLLNKPLKNTHDLDGFGYWKLKNSAIVLSEVELKNATLDLVVENMGRVNVGNLTQFYQWKGLKDQVYLDYQPITKWKILPLEFKKQWNKALDGWHDVKNSTTPALYKMSFHTDSPQDTYVNMKNWNQGIVIVNGFVLGRHMFLGPQLTLYLPRSLLVKGTNDIIVFEHFRAAEVVEFSSEPIWTNQRLQINRGSRIKGGIIDIIFVFALFIKILY